MLATLSASIIQRTPLLAAAVSVALLVGFCPPPASAASDAASALETTVTASPLAGFVGKWLVDDAEPSDNVLVLRLEGSVLVGDSPSGRGTLRFSATDKPGVAKGTVTDPDDGTMPATVEMSRGGDRLIIELAPPHSEFVTATARRAKPEKSDPDVDGGLSAAQARVDAAKEELRKALDSDDEQAVKMAKTELQEARRALEETGAGKQSSPGRSKSVASGDAAIECVAAMPDVKAWMSDVAAAAKRSGEQRSARFSVEEEGGKFVVHVFENVGTGDDSHTATFGWYNVDKTTGEITPMSMD